MLVFVFLLFPVFPWRPRFAIVLLRPEAAICSRCSWGRGPSMPSSWPVLPSSRWSPSRTSLCFGRCGEISSSCCGKRNSLECWGGGWRGYYVEVWARVMVFWVPQKEGMDGDHLAITLLDINGRPYCQALCSTRKQIQST